MRNIPDNVQRNPRKGIRVKVLLNRFNHLKLAKNVDSVGLGVVLEEKGNEVQRELNQVVRRLVLVQSLLELLANLEAEVAHVFVTP